MASGNLSKRISSANEIHVKICKNQYEVMKEVEVLKTLKAEYKVSLGRLKSMSSISNMKIKKDKRTPIQGYNCFFSVPHDS